MGELVVALAVFGIVLLVFLICRAIVLWYWKIDKIEEHLAAIRGALEKEAKI